MKPPNEAYALIEKLRMQINYMFQERGHQKLYDELKSGKGIRIEIKPDFRLYVTHNMPYEAEKPWSERGK